MALTIECIADPAAGRVVDHPLPLEDGAQECDLWLDCLPGAQAVEAAIKQDGALVALAEVATRPEEPVHLHLRRLPDARWQIRSERVVHTLPLEARDGRRLLRRHDGEPLQIFFLVDATARRVSAEGDGFEVEPLLSPAHSAPWDDCVAALVSFAAGLVAKHPSWRMAALAYGDTSDDLEDVTRELRPRWAVYPERPDDRRPQRGDLDLLHRSLAAIPPTPGGDFVDALAEGMQACADAAMNEPGRKVLVIFGDSPGHEISHDVPPFADAQLRSCDVDEQAARLFELGFEVVTVYNDRGDVDPQGLAFKTTEWNRYLDFARRQYARLASIPGWAFQRSRFDPAEAARRLLERPVVIGRGACPGILRP
ncbi:MAG: hypothetical protein GC160_08630 [Acidobacteria bacterium]|nr:hypothetical protein [Acidobacteriota bacterium]